MSDLAAIILNIKEQLTGTCGMYLDEPVSNWPQLQVTWSEKPNERYMAFDGDIPEWAAPPENLLLGHALISDIHVHLIYARRIDNVEQLREGAIDDKIEEVINHWINGDALTPPALRIVEINSVKKIDIPGGNHRFNVANLSGENTINFLASSSDSQSLEELIPSLKWKS